MKTGSKYDLPDDLVEDGAFVDPGVLVDDDGRVYIYCGFERSYMAELKDNMYEVSVVWNYIYLNGVCTQGCNG